MLLTTNTTQSSDLDLLTALVGSRRAAARMLVSANGSVHTLLCQSRGSPAGYACCEAGKRYRCTPQAKLLAAHELVGRAMLESLAQNDAMTSPIAVRAFLINRLTGLPHEVFVMLMLDAQHRVIAFSELFRGTLAQTSVYPREVVKAVLHANAAAVIFAHNHPSGIPEPSRADELLTQSLKQALALVDVRTLDHFIVAGTKATSFAERGLI